MPSPVSGKSRIVPSVLLALALCAAPWPVLTHLSAMPALAAEYDGQLLDGQTFDGVAYSYHTAKYYNVQVEFEGDEATIYFSNGGFRVITLDDEEIDDPHSISCYDYERGTYWDLDLEGVD